ncbi:alpha/beta fold hydrolase, partial [bacterium]|nr:alpha/beta fold hydrolase [bacterium]
VIRKITSDGVAVAMEYIAVEGAPPRGGVVLVHMLGRTRADWEPLIGYLTGKWLAVVAIDLRGHGQSAYGGLDFTNFETEEWLGCTRDIRSSLDYLAEKVDGPYFLIGASIGANLVLLEAAEDERVAGVVMLSPGSDYHGVKPAEGVEGLGERPALLVAAKDDAYSYETVAALAGDFTDAETKLYTDGGHGTHLFAPRPEVLTFIADWLETHLEE